MPSYTMLNVKMQRDSNTIPWGFRMQGGTDFGSPLQIQHVNPNSLAEQSGMRTNDYILRIGQMSTEYLQHKEAQECIKRQNNTVELSLQRGSPPSSADYNSVPNFSTNQTDFLPRSPDPQMVMPSGNNRVVLSNTYNTPIGLYSADNVTDTIAHTLKSLNMAPNFQMEEPKSSNEFKPSSVKAMPKPAPYNYPQQPRPEPFHAPSKPNTTSKPSFNVNIQAASGSGGRIIQRGGKGSASLNRNDSTNQRAICYACGINIRGPFITAIGRCYCVDHFTCSNCSINLMDCGFVEENGRLYCEHDFEQYLAPHCVKCGQKILKECVHALDKTYHPECFLCTACRRPLGAGSFHIEEGQPYCTEDYRRMFQAKCTGCDFPIEPGDKYLEAMGGTYHAECFNCSSCQVSLDGQPFVVKNNRPYCRQHGRPMTSLFH